METQISGDRARLCRERHKNGLRVAPVQIFRDEIEWLVSTGLLNNQHQNDIRAIGIAIEALIERSTKSVAAQLTVSVPTPATESSELLSALPPQG
jgi:hypothetical protein